MTGLVELMVREKPLSLDLVPIVISYNVEKLYLRKELARWADLSRD